MISSITIAAEHLTWSYVFWTDYLHASPIYLKDLPIIAAVRIKPQKTIIKNAGHAL